MNSKALSFFEQMASNVALTPNSVKLAKNSDFSTLDVQFIRKYAGPESEVLDIGSGTGLIVNKLYPYVRTVVAVEPFKQFTDFIDKSKNITVINADIFDFVTDRKFNVITLFAIMHYLDREQAAQVYEKCFPLLEHGGSLIIKNQFGIHEDVTINGFSEELGTDYHAQYRQIDSEAGLLKKIGFRNIQITDIYPQEYNRWNNTHFYAIVGQKNN